MLIITGSNNKATTRIFKKINPNWTKTVYSPGGLDKENGFFTEKELLVNLRMRLMNYLEKAVYVNIQVQCYLAIYSFK